MHLNAAATAELAQRYHDDGMLAYVELVQRKEKELVKQGKKPFFLKKSEQKKLLLMDKYAGMSKSQVDKAIEKKRKKVAGKEKKQLPYARRAME